MRRRREGEPKNKHGGGKGLLHALILAISCTAANASQLDDAALRALLPPPLTKTDFPAFDPGKVKLGQLLFYDPILSGNRNISCATCHSIDHGTGDGLSLGIGQGGQGVGPARRATDRERIRKRIPRNAQGLWNLAAKEISVMFHDGRVSLSDRYENRFDTPAEEWLPNGLDNLLAAQALFPLTSQFEMAGNPKENEVAGAAYDRIDYVWPILAKRVRIIPEYTDLFRRTYPDVDQSIDVSIVHIANALSAFMGSEWMSFDSAYDAFRSGDDAALSRQQKRGLELFYGKGRCSACHSGNLFTDQGFHALALPHFGPGRTRRFDPHVRDVGRMGETDRLEDAYRFRTPSLRNVGLTAPYGHNGAYRTLEGIIRHHADPLTALDAWRTEEAGLPDIPWLADADFIAFSDTRERARLRAKVDIEPVALSDAEIADLVAFLNALTGTESVKGRLGRPASVPSGLAVD